MKIELISKEWKGTRRGGLYIEESTVDICEMTMREGEISRKKEREKSEGGRYLMRIRHKNRCDGIKMGRPTN